MSAESGRPRLSRQGQMGLAILAGGFLVLAGLAAAPFFLRQSIRPALDDGRRMEALIEAKLKAAIESRKPQAVTAANADRAFVQGETAGLASASLQRIMVDLASSNNMFVQKVQPLPVEDSTGLARLRLEIEATGNLENLRNYLLAIESGEPLIFVKEFHIATAAGFDPATSDNPSDNLSVNLQVEAYSWWGPAT